MDDLRLNTGPRPLDPALPSRSAGTEPNIRVTPEARADAVARAGAAMRRAGGRLRAESAERGAPALEKVGGVLDSVGDYLERRQLPGLRRDAERAIVAKPVVALLIAAAVGYVAARAIRS